MKRRVYKKASFSITGALVFFATIALVMQIAILVYDYIIERTDDNATIAVLMLIMIVILSAVCVVADIIRRKIMIDRPVERILDATERIASGDFSARIEVAHLYGDYDAYDLIAENLNTMAAELGKSEVLKTDFISNLSHELKTPLAVIQSYATALTNMELDEQTQRHYRDTILSASKRLANLVNNILKLNKLENQEIVPEFEKINLTAMLSEAVLSFESLVESKDIELECELDDVVIFSVPAYLEIIFNNLISNAIKFTDSGGKIRVCLKAGEDSAVVEVSDTGCGISSEIGGRIFEKFYQGDTSHSGEGNGLGLALVKKVIDVLGGEISVESELGKGSTFRIVLRGLTDE